MQGINNVKNVFIKYCDLKEEYFVLVQRQKYITHPREKDEFVIFNTYQMSNTKERDRDLQECV